MRTPRRDPPEHVKVRDVAWEELTFPDDRRYLEIVCKDYRPVDGLHGVRPLETWCECGSHLAFVRAEAVMRRPDTCCCGGCRVPMLLIIGACPGWRADDDAVACSAVGEEMGFVHEGDAVRLFFEPVPVVTGA